MTLLKNTQITTALTQVLNAKPGARGASLDLLKLILKQPSWSGHEDAMIRFLTLYAEARGWRTYTHKRNVYIENSTASGFKPCWVAHTDTVHRHVDKLTILTDTVAHPNSGAQCTRLRATDEMGTPVGCGGDDKAGIFIALQMLEAIPDSKAAFFHGEEIGCVGAGQADDRFFEEVAYVIEFDCPGNDSYSRNCWNTPLFSEVFEERLAPVLGSFGICHGKEHPFTDVVPLKAKYDFVCMNLASGYYNMHSTQEYVIYEDTLNTIEAAKAVHQLLGRNKQYFPQQPNGWAQLTAFQPYELPHVEDAIEDLEHSISELESAIVDSDAIAYESITEAREYAQLEIEALKESFGKKADRLGIFLTANHVEQSREMVAGELESLHVKRQRLLNSQSGASQPDSPAGTLRNLLVGGDPLAQARLEAVLAEAGDEALLWYPSAGNDYRDICEMQESRLALHGISEAPTLFCHTDYSPRYARRRPGVLFEDARTQVELLENHELSLSPAYEVSYRVSGGYATSPKLAPEQPEVHLMKLRIHSDRLGCFEAWLFYFVFENINFLEEVLLRHRLNVSHFVKVREGCGMGGCRKCISQCYSLLGNLHIKYLLVDNEVHYCRKTHDAIALRAGIEHRDYDLIELGSIASWSGFPVKVFEAKPLEALLTESRLETHLKAISGGKKKVWEGGQ